MSFLQFSDEVIFDIFQYLYFPEIVYSFYDPINCNKRLNELIDTRLRSIYLSKVDLRFMTKSQFIYICRYLKSNEHLLEKIRYLTLSNQYTFGQIRLFLSQLSFEQMINLKKLTLIEPALDEYRVLFPRSMTQLKHLKWNEPECDDEGRIILIDEMNELIELEIVSSSTVQFRSQYARLERLTVSQMHLNDLIGFQTFFPNLHYLDITLVGNVADVTKIHIPLLTVLKLRSYDIEQDVCEKFLLNFLQVRELYYSNYIECNDKYIVDGYRCQKMIEHLPLLEKFEVDIYLYDVKSTDICELSASFQNSFYLSKNWNIICETYINPNEFHIYSLPMPMLSELEIRADSLIASTVVPIDDAFSNVENLKINMTSNWPFVTRFFPNVRTLELLQLNHSQMIPTLSVMSYLNKSMFLSNIRKLFLPSPCHFEDTLLRNLLQQSAINIIDLEISCNYLIHLIRTNMLQAPLPIRILTLHDDYLSVSDENIFIEFFQTTLNCLSLYLPNHHSLPESIKLFLDRLKALFSLDIYTHDPVTMFVHIQLCQVIKERPQASAEIHPTNIRIWQK